MKQFHEEPGLSFSVNLDLKVNVKFCRKHLNLILIKQMSSSILRTKVHVKCINLYYWNHMSNIILYE